MEGLSSNGVLRALKLQKSRGEELLTFNEDLISVEAIKNIFEPVFTIPEDEREHNVYYYFSNFIEEIATDNGIAVNVNDIDEIEDGKENVRQLEKK